MSVHCFTMKFKLGEEKKLRNYQQPNIGPETDEAHRCRLSFLASTQRFFLAEQQ